MPLYEVIYTLLYTKQFISALRFYYSTICDQTSLNDPLLNASIHIGLLGRALVPASGPALELGVARSITVFVIDAFGDLKNILN